MNSKERYDLLRSKIEEQYRADIAALDRVFAMEQNLGLAEESGNLSDNKILWNHVSAVKVSGSTDESETAPKGAVMDAVWNVASVMQDAFTWKDVAASLHDIKPDMAIVESSVRQAVNRLAATGKLEIAEQGRGRSPSFFRVKHNG